MEPVVRAPDVDFGHTKFVCAFFSQLVALGYISRQFRVTVRHVTSEGDTRQRYTVLVAQLRDGVPYRGKRYVGGYGGEWVNGFSRDALTPSRAISTPFGFQRRVAKRSTTRLLRR